MNFEQFPPKKASLEKNEVTKKEKKEETFSDQREASKRKSELKEAEIQAREEDLTKIRALEKAAGLELSETKLEIQQEVREERDNFIETRVVDAIKIATIDHIESEAYLKRLSLEFGGDMERAKQEQQRRIRNLETVEIHLKSLEDVNRERQELQGLSKDDLVGGFYNFETHRLLVADDYFDYENIARHEINHAITKAPLEITDSAWSLLKKAYQKQGLFGIFSAKDDGYYGYPAEMMARKKSLDRDLEKLGIKKYEGEFTSEHQKKLQEAYEKGQLSQDSVDFIKRLKEGYLKKILNEIAENKNQDIDFAA